MRWLARVFASAIARRLAYVLVAATLAWCGMGKAQAAVSQPAAYSQCMAQARNYESQWPGVWVNGRCINNAAENAYHCYYDQHNQGQVSLGLYCGGFGYDPAQTCGTKSDYNGAFPGVYGAPKSGAVQCSSGCMQVWTPNADGTWNGTYAVNATCDSSDDSADQCKNMGLTTGYHYNNYTKTCEPDTQECPAGKEHNAKGECVEQACPKGMTLTQLGTCENEKNECPAGEVKSPEGSCLPGEGQCAAGEAKGKDGTCKRDADGDGKPDEGEEDGDTKPTFAGGDSCDSPPACSGDVILCGQARIQWRIDCNTRRDVNIQGGTCSSPPVCVGKNCKALEYSQLLMQWRTACALEKAGSGGGNGDNADVKAIRDAITGTNGQANIGEDGSNSGAFSDESGYGQGGMPDGKLDTSGFGYSRSCPTIPDVAVFGQTLHFDTSRFCQWMVLGGQIVLVMAALLSIRLMSQGGT